MEIKLSTAIKKLRAAKGVTQEELAEYIGVSFQAVSKWETGATMPDIALLPRLAVFFGVRIDDLFLINTDDEIARIDFMLEHENLTDENFAYAKRTLDSILQGDENDTGALKRYARLYLARNNRDALAAGRMLEKAMALSPADPEIFTLYRQARGGDSYTARSGNDWFIRVCEPYAKKYPSNGTLCENLLEALVEMRYFEKAEEILKRMEAAGGDFAGMYEIFKGDIQCAKGNVREAMRIWDGVDVKNHKGQYEAGERFHRLNEYDKAIRCFQNSFAAAKFPRDLSAVYSLAFLYKKLGRASDAIAEWQRILDVLESDYGVWKGASVDWPKEEIAKLKAQMT